MIKYDSTEKNITLEVHVKLMTNHEMIQTLKLIVGLLAQRWL